MVKKKKSMNMEKKTPDGENIKCPIQISPLNFDEKQYESVNHTIANNIFLK